MTFHSRSGSIVATLLVLCTTPSLFNKMQEYLTLPALFSFRAKRLLNNMPIYKVAILPHGLAS